MFVRHYVDTRAVSIVRMISGYSTDHDMSVSSQHRHCRMCWAQQDNIVDEVGTRRIVVDILGREVCSPSCLPLRRVASHISWLTPPVRPLNPVFHLSHTSFALRIVVLGSSWIRDQNGMLVGLIHSFDLHYRPPYILEWPFALWSSTLVCSSRHLFTFLRDR